MSGWLRRLLHDDGRLRLSEALHGQGLALPQDYGHASARALGMAARRCVTCAQQRRCDELLAAGDWTLLREICPNTAYIDSLRAR